MLNAVSGGPSIAIFGPEKKGLDGRLARQGKMARIEFEEFPKGTELAYIAEGPPDDRLATGFFWLGGFMSEMQGSKGEALSRLSRDTRRSLLRFDYSGHGQSGGEFLDGTISAWLEQATHMFLRLTKGRRVIVGSSMGGWLALLLARKLLAEDPFAASRIAGLVLIAPAADMTKDLMWDCYGDEARKDLARHGVYHQPSDFGVPYPVTLKLLKDGENHLLLEKGLKLPVPVRILQGTRDTDVPAEHAVRLMQAVQAEDISLTLVKDGDHRLSTPAQLRIIQDAALALAQRADGQEF
jgi:pimeloyl-ACP methyl ester carboxylesterase